MTLYEKTDAHSIKRSIKRGNSIGPKHTANTQNIGKKIFLVYLNLRLTETDYEVQREEKTEEGGQNEAERN